jgi:dTDP-4-amino-4,6-dideoxygalactose transaminase
MPVGRHHKVVPTRRRAPPRMKLPMPFRIPLHRAYMAPRELEYVARARAQGALAGNGPYGGMAEQWLKQYAGGTRALLTHSCTAALEMAALLADIRQGDEVILPSFTFSSTANAFVLRGATPVFVDIRPDTLNVDESLIASAVTPRTRVIVPVHYAGVACEMDTIGAIARQHRLLVVEDAAQGVLASWRGRPLGSIGEFGTFSFHETKIVTCGEGGALLVNDARFIERAEIIREKGTDRSEFRRGTVDRYTWRDVGSSYCPSEIAAAYLVAQFEAAHSIRDRRVALWNRYHAGLEACEASGRLRRPTVPPDCAHNANQYHILLADSAERERVQRQLGAAGVGAAFHFVPLHSSPMGRAVGRVAGTMAHTDDLSARLLRLPLWVGMEEYFDDVLEHVIVAVGT